MKEPSSPKKRKEASPSKARQMSKDQKEQPQPQEGVRKYKAVPDISFTDGPSAPNSKKSSDLGLIEGQQQDEEEAQNTHVQVDLFKGIGLMAKSKQLAAICGLLGAFMIHLIVGAIYRWNMITQYVGIYFDVDRMTPIGAPLSMLCTGITMRIGVKIGQVLGGRFIIGVGVFLATIATLISSQMQRFGTFLLFHNVLYGLASGLLFLPPILQVHKFFPKLKLITNSIILTGTGLGAVLFGANNIQCIQNDEQTIEIPFEQRKAIIDGQFSSCYIKMGIYVFLIGIAGLLMMIPMILRNQQRDREEREVSVEQRSGNFCPNQCTAFRSRVFWMVSLFIFLSTCGNYYIIMNFKNLLAKQYYQRSFLYWILISGALANGLPRLFWGFLFSRIGFKTLFLIAAILNLTSFIVIMATNNNIAYLIFYTFNSLSLGGLMVIFPNLTLIIFGKKIGQQIYSYYWIVFSLSSLFQFTITLILTNQPQSSDDFAQVLFFFSICTIVSSVLCYRQKLQGPWNNSMDLIQLGRNRRVKKYDY